MRLLDNLVLALLLGLCAASKKVEESIKSENSKVSKEALNSLLDEYFQWKVDTFKFHYYVQGRVGSCSQIPKLEIPKKSFTEKNVPSAPTYP